MTEPFKFELYDYYPDDIPDVYRQIEACAVPFDTLFRLGALGCREADPSDTNKSWQWQILQDIAKNGENTTALRADTQQILYGPLPNLVIDFNKRSNRDGYPQLKTMYYTLGDMASAIRESRDNRGIKVYNPLLPDYYSQEEKEWRTCVGDARKIWRTLVRRIEPKVLIHPDRFCMPTISYGHVHELSDRSMQRRIVGYSVISDQVLVDIFEEATITGVKGIARMGKDSLRRLLTEEHAELDENYIP